VTLLGPAPTPATASHRRGVTLLTGFLGSGKTTLLRTELDRTGSAAPAVILNDFGHTLVDDVLLGEGRAAPVVISGGCACCTRREELAGALRGLLDAEQRGSAAAGGHVVIETSGLSDPGPIAYTLADDPVLKHHYELARICVTVDALTGLTTLADHGVALRQLLAADDLLVTKADIAGQRDVDRLVGRLQELNPTAAIIVTGQGEVVARHPPRSAASAGRPCVTPDQQHANGVRTLELVTAEPLDWQAFAVWLSLPLHRSGPEVLRVKGVLDVEGVGPVGVNGVQHVMHAPEHLSGAVPPGTRLVVIVQDLDPQLVERSFHLIQNL
jgi:G3E family GTPase